MASDGQGLVIADIVAVGVRPVTAPFEHIDNGDVCHAWH
jgi:hypothetical protein